MAGFIADNFWRKDEPEEETKGDIERVIEFFKARPGEALKFRFEDCAGEYSTVCRYDLRDNRCNREKALQSGAVIAGEDPVILGRGEQVLSHGEDTSREVELPEKIRIGGPHFGANQMPCTKIIWFSSVAD